MQDVIFELPVTKSMVTMKSYLTTGQSRDLQRVLLSSGAIDIQKANVDNLSPETALDMQDRAAEFLIKEVKNSDGAVVTFGTEITVKNWLYDLPVGDGNVIYDKLNEVITAASLPEDTKKK